MASNFSHINHYFDHVYVLNLEHRPDRKIAMLQKLSRLGIEAEFVQAINGYSTNNKLEHQAYLDRPLGNHPMEISQERKLISSPGAWGYLKTYLGILFDAKKRGFERILCLDDDVLFHNDFENRFLKATNTITQDWKLLYLGASQYLWKVPQNLCYPDPSKKEVDSDALFYFPKSTDGSFAMGICSSVYNILIQSIQKMNCPFDSGPLRDVIQIYPKDCYVLNPNVIIADVSESDIREGQDQNQLATQLKWNIEDYNFPTQLDLVSIIMPAFNADKTIEKSIRSILIQSYPALELIVVDDASSDGTVDIVEQLIKKDPRIRLVQLPSNVGVGEARNEGIKASKGSIIGFQDADDISLKDRIAYQLVPIYEKGVLFTVSRFYRSRCTSDELDIYDQDATIELVKSRRRKNAQGKAYSYRDRSDIGMVTTLFKRIVFEKYGLYGDHRFGEDLEMVERILFYTLNKRFDTTYNGHTFLGNHSSIPKTLQRVEKSLYISPDFGDGNLTTQYHKKEKEKLQIQSVFRNKFNDGNLDQYQKLAPLNQKVRFPSRNYNTLILDRFVLIPEIEYSILMNQENTRQEADQSNLTIDEVYNSLSWKITSPIRWVANILIRLFRK
ncbi:MAG: glycosyltransferase [Saprospiraceae bacterium]|nr:glycosyltransferase [Saprospiraceae bacterium]